MCPNSSKVGFAFQKTPLKHDSQPEQEVGICTVSSCPHIASSIGCAILLTTANTMGMICLFSPPNRFGSDSRDADTSLQLTMPQLQKATLTCKGSISQIYVSMSHEACFYCSVTVQILARNNTIWYRSVQLSMHDRCFCCQTLLCAVTVLFLMGCVFSVASIAPLAAATCIQASEL